MKKRVGPKRVWVVTDGAGRGVYSVHRTREKARAACYFWGSRAVLYALMAALVACTSPPYCSVCCPADDRPETVGNYAREHHCLCGCAVIEARVVPTASSTPTGPR